MGPPLRDDGATVPETLVPCVAELTGGGGMLCHGQSQTGSGGGARPRKEVGAPGHPSGRQPQRFPEGQAPASRPSANCGLNSRRHRPCSPHTPAGETPQCQGPAAVLSLAPPAGPDTEQLPRGPAACRQPLMRQEPPRPGSGSRQEDARLPSPSASGRDTSCNNTAPRSLDRSQNSSPINLNSASFSNWTSRGWTWCPGRSVARRTLLLALTGQRTFPEVPRKTRASTIPGNGPSPPTDYQGGYVQP